MRPHTPIVLMIVGLALASPAAWSQQAAGSGTSVEAEIRREAVAAGEQVGGSLSVIAAYEAARTFDPKYRSAEKDYEASKEYRALGRSNLLPQVSAQYGRNRNYLKSDTAGPVTALAPDGRYRAERDYPSETSTLQLRQPLINFDGYARWRQGELQALYGETTFVLRGNDLVLRVSEAYTNVLLASEQLRLARAQVDAFTEQQAASQRLFQGGEGTRTDVLEGESSLKLGKAAVIRAQSDLDSARAQLASITGPTAQGLPIWKSEPFRPLNLQLLTLAEWEEASKKHSLEIAARELSLAGALEEINKAKAGHLPRVDLVAGITNSTSDAVNTVGSAFRNRFAGIQLQMPIFSGGATSALVRQAVANYEKAQADLDDTRGSVILEVRKQFAAVESGALQVEALEAAAESAQLQIAATRRSVSGGIRINLDVLRALQQQTLTARDLSRARFEYIQAWLRLRAAAGLLEPIDLHDVSVQLQQSASTSHVIRSAR